MDILATQLFWRQCRDGQPLHCPPITKRRHRSGRSTQYRHLSLSTVAQEAFVLECTCPTYILNLLPEDSHSSRNNTESRLQCPAQGEALYCKALPSTPPRWC